MRFQVLRDVILLFVTVVLFAHLAFFNFVPRLLVKVCNFVRLTNTNRAADDDDSINRLYNVNDRRKERIKHLLAFSKLETKRCARVGGRTILLKKRKCLRLPFFFGMTELVEEAKKKYQTQRKNKSVLYLILIF